MKMFSKLIKYFCGEPARTNVGILIEDILKEGGWSIGSKPDGNNPHYYGNSEKILRRGNISIRVSKYSLTIKINEKLYFGSDLKEFDIVAILDTFNKVYTNLFDNEHEDKLKKFENDILQEIRNSGGSQPLKS